VVVTGVGLCVVMLSAGKWPNAAAFGCRAVPPGCMLDCLYYRYFAVDFVHACEGGHDSMMCSFDHCDIAAAEHTDGDTNTALALLKR
jgi:hypothetical protein